MSFWYDVPYAELTRLIVPMRKVVWEKNKDFMESDPLDAYFWATEGGEWSAWDEIHRGASIFEDL